MKHGVAFEDAALVFHDIERLEVYDRRANYEEDRWVTIGFVYSVVLYVVYTIRRKKT